MFRELVVEKSIFLILMQNSFRRPIKYSINNVFQYIFISYRNYNFIDKIKCYLIKTFTNEKLSILQGVSNNVKTVFLDYFYNKYFDGSDLTLNMKT